MKISSYTKVYFLGHRFVSFIMHGEYQVEEKIDGSQISFGRINGKKYARSRGRMLDLDNPESLFDKAIKFINDSDLPEGCVLRGEYLKQPKHNTLSYAKVPENHIIIFDIEDTIGNPITDESLFSDIVYDLKLQVSQILKKGTSPLSSEKLLSFLDRESCLGGEKIEGIVIKNYNRCTTDGKYMVAKYVSERFKERHNKDYKDRNPSQSGIIEKICSNLKTEARWIKAVQHLRDNGELLNEPKDIGALLKEIHLDIDIEERDYIEEILYNYFIKNIKREVCKGFAEWYKERLLREGIDGNSSS